MRFVEFIFDESFAVRMRSEWRVITGYMEFRKLPFEEFCERYERQRRSTGLAEGLHGPR